MIYKEASRFSKEGYSWFKKSEAVRGEDTEVIYTHPVVAPGVYKRASSSRKEAVDFLHKDGHAELALHEGWVLMKLKLVDMYIAKKELLSIPSPSPKNSQKSLKPKRKYVRRPSVENNASPSSK